MKRNLMIVCLLSITCLSHAVKMPGADVLNERLKEEGLEDFAKVSNIAGKLSSNNFEAVGIVTKVTLCFMDYETHVNKKYSKDHALMMLSQFDVVKRNAYRAILKDYPETLKELEEANFYEPFQ